MNGVKDRPSGQKFSPANDGTCKGREKPCLREERKKKKTLEKKAAIRGKKFNHVAKRKKKKKVGNPIQFWDKTSHLDPGSPGREGTVRESSKRCRKEKRKRSNI